MTSVLDYVAKPQTDSKMRTHSGIYFDLANPEASQVSVRDIAHHISRQARFAGATRGSFPLSVAQHSVLVGDLVRLSQPITGSADGKMLSACALLHDAHEAYVTDITYPVKTEILRLCANAGLHVDVIAFMKQRVQKVIHEALGVIWPVPQLWAERIKLADSAALVIERSRFTSAGDEEKWFENESFTLDFDPSASSAYHSEWGHDQAKAMFLGWADGYTGIKT